MLMYYMNTNCSFIVGNASTLGGWFALDNFQYVNFVLLHIFFFFAVFTFSLEHLAYDNGIGIAITTAYDCTI
jgi:hypothetical protein